LKPYVSDRSGPEKGRHPRSAAIRSRLARL
jgi:hypothetical protein